MTRPINASLFVSDFLATATPGEYTIVGATFNNQADATNNGAGDVTVGFTLYVPAFDLSLGAPIPGVFHRYRLTSVSSPDANTLNATILWDESGPEQDVPASSSFCMLSQPSTEHGFSMLPLDSVYPGLPSGMTSAALVLENRDVTDAIVGMTPGTPKYVKVSGVTMDAVPVILGPAVPLSLSAFDTLMFSINVIGRRSDQPNQCIVLTIAGSAYMNELSNQLTIFGGTFTTVHARHDTSWYAIALANVSANTIDVQVMGSAGASLNWSATLSLTIL